MTSALNLPDLLALAEGAARQAGEALKRREAEWISVHVLADRDIKMAADRAAEAAILRALSGSGLPVLAEESGITGELAAGPFWVVDPLDGTANYQMDLPLWCVAIALMQGSTPLLGVVFDPNRDEMFTALPGRGAWLNHAPITVSAAASTDAAVLVTGLPVRRDFSDDALAAFGRDLARWRKVRMLGSAALSLAYVACGRADCYREDAIMLWDVAAGAALVAAAGGRVEISDAAAAAPRRVVATNGRLDPGPA